MRSLGFLTVAEKNKGILDHDKEMLPKFSFNLSAKNYEPSKEKKIYQLKSWFANGKRKNTEA